MRKLVAVALLAAASGIAVAQTAAPTPAPAVASVAVTAAQQQTVVDRLATALVDDFVFPEVGRKYAAAIRGKLAAGGYAALDSVAFAQALTADLQAVHEDRHIRVSPPGTQRRRMMPNGQPMQAMEEAKWAAPGVAYVKFNMFTGDPETVSALERFMASHADAKALIIDARTHRGGGLAEMDVMFPYLYAEATPLVRMDTRAAVVARGGGPIDEGPTVKALSGPEGVVRREHVALPGKATGLRNAKVFYLTSARTASAAEHLALALKRTGRATLIGETTRGAGHYGGFADLGDGFSAFVPVGRTFDPDTGEGWEGKGVAPHVAVPADKALDEALKLAGAQA